MPAFFVGAVLAPRAAGFGVSVVALAGCAGADLALADVGFFAVFAVFVGAGAAALRAMFAPGRWAGDRATIVLPAGFFTAALFVAAFFDAVCFVAPAFFAALFAEAFFAAGRVAERTADFAADLPAAFFASGLPVAGFLTALFFAVALSTAVFFEAFFLPAFAAITVSSSVRRSALRVQLTSPQ